MNEEDQNRLSRYGYCMIDADARAIATVQHLPPNCLVIALFAVGEADMELNMECLQVAQGMCAGYSSLSQLRVLRVSADFRVRFLLLNYELVLATSEGIETTMLQRMLESPTLKVTDAHLWAMLCSMFDALESYLSAASITVDVQVSGAIVRSVMVVLSQLAAQGPAGGAKRRPFTMADTYFRRFVQLVSEHVKQEHEVGFYADRLHITPKYLSEICKQKTSHKAKEIISQMLLRSIKRDLLMSGKSMKSMASEYGFADQSSMGKFFRKMTGLSPLHYKQHEATRDQSPAKS